MNTPASPAIHRGPSLSMLGAIYTVLFVGGLIISTRMAGQTYVSPFTSEDAILQFFRMHADAVRVQAFIVFVSSIPLGIYTATVVSRVHSENFVSQHFHKFTVMG